MIIDSSALIAIVRGEPSAPSLIAALAGAKRRRMSAATLVEASIVADGPRDPVRSSRFDRLVADLEVDIIPLTEGHAQIARQAYRDYGRGSGHAANLNFGDCFSYALATDLREPLLYVGNDFVHTDVRSALD